MDRKKFIFTFFILPWASLLVALIPALKIRADDARVENRITLEARQGTSTSRASVRIRVKTEINGEVKENIEIYENEHKPVEYKKIIKEGAVETKTEVCVREENQTPSIFPSFLKAFEPKDSKESQFNTGSYPAESPKASTKASFSPKKEIQPKENAVASETGKNTSSFSSIIAFWGEMAKRIFSLVWF